MDIIRNLEKNNIKPFYLETKEEVVDVVSQLLNEGDTVATGGSHSLFESGVIELLESGRYNFLNRYAVPRENRRDIELKSMDAERIFLQLQRSYRGRRII
jgi:hypothetical protein